MAEGRRECQRSCGKAWNQCYLNHGLIPGTDYSKHMPPAAIVCNSNESICMKKCPDGEECPKCPECHNFQGLQDTAWALLVLVAVAVGALLMWLRRPAHAVSTPASTPRHIVQAIPFGARRQVDRLPDAQRPLMLDDQPASAGPPISENSASATDDLI